LNTAMATDMYPLFYKLVNQHQTKKILVRLDESISSVKSRILQQENHDDTHFCQIATDEMLLFDTDEDKTPLMDFKICKGDVFYVFIFPVALLSKRFTPCTSLISQNDSMLGMSEYWKPSVAQTDLGQSVFLSVLAAVQHMCSKQLFHPSHIVQVIRKRLQSSPAALVLHHLLIQGSLVNIEKSIFSVTWFHYLRAILPLAVEDKNLFLHTPVVMGSLLRELNELSTEDPKFEEYNLTSSLTHETISDPVTLAWLPGQLWDRTELNEIPVEERKDKIGRMYDEAQFQTHTPLKALIHCGISLPNSYYVSTYKSNILQWEPPQRWSSSMLRDAQEMLTSSAMLRPLTFLSKDNCHSSGTYLTLDEDQNCVYVYGPFKQNRNVFHVCHPFQPQEQNIERSSLLDSNLFASLNLPVSSTGDLRPIKQVDVVLLDLSSSMATRHADGMTRLEAAKAYFSAFIDKCISFQLPHVIGIVFFGHRLESIPLNRDLEHIQEEFGRFSSDLGRFTNLYGAIQDAVKMFQQFSNTHRHQLDPQHTFRIFSLTDGEDNVNAEKAENISKALLQHKIIFDSILIGDDVSGASVRALSHVTGGWCFKGNNPQQVLPLFERETILGVYERPARNANDSNINLQQLEDLTRYPYTTNIEKPKTGKLLKKAVASANVQISNINNNVGRGQWSHTRRVLYEFHKLCNSPLTLFHIFLAEDDLSFWKVIFEGETGTPYANGKFLLFVQFPESYPLSPPEIRFDTKIYHCNINDDGKVCHEIIGDKWTPLTSVKEILDCIVDMIRNPNPDDALDSIKGALYQEDKEAYTANVKSWVEQYASRSVEQLKLDYKME